MRRVTLLVPVLAILLAMQGRAAAQTATGQITGTVNDTTGAVMSEASKSS